MRRQVSESIFPVLSIDRAQSRWEEQLHALTPVEMVGEAWFKREDRFAPLGYGGINGSKLRQLIYMLHAYAQRQPGGMLVSGASVLSPQLSMSSAVAMHLGLGALQVIGATNPASCMKHENVAIAARFGARFEIINIAYNTALQQRVKKLVEAAGSYYLHYGIAPHDAPEDIEAFHRLGAEQVANIPEQVTDLVVPAGSCNSATSVLYGLALQRRKLRIHLLGIGKASGPKLIKQRIATLQAHTGTPITDYLGDCTYIDLGTKYEERVPWSYGGVEFHPTYEGKVMRYITQEEPGLLNPQTCIWIIGSPGRWGAMAPHVGELPAEFRAMEDSPCRPA